MRKDYVVPAATLAAALVGGVGGVVIGGRMNRATMRALENERAAREDVRDKEHADREDARDAAQQQRAQERELAAERRLAVASLHLLMDEFARAKSHLDFERQTSGGDPMLPEHMDEQMHLLPEDKRIIALWVSDDTWWKISKTLQRIEVRSIRRAMSRELYSRGLFDAADDYRARSADAAAVVAETQRTLESEVRRVEQLEQSSD